MSIKLFNELQINETEEFKLFSEELNFLIDFFEEFSNLLSYNGRIISFNGNNQYYNLKTELIDSVCQSLKSIKLCCSIGSFSDANTLIRKMRDDLFLYLFIVNIITERYPKFDNKIMNEDELAVLAWFGNSVDKLSNKTKKKISFENYMNVLTKNKNIHKILSELNLQVYWDSLRVKLNNYVHNNGIDFSKLNFINADNQSLNVFFNNICKRTEFISSLFIAILLMIDSGIFMSSDYIDHIDLNFEPPENSQNWIASFVQEFIDTKIIKLHPELKQFIKQNNIGGMEIS